MRKSNSISKGFFSLEILFLVVFICLNTLWIVPDTLTIKYICLGIGCLITLFYFLQYGSIFPFTYSNILIGLFFLWVIFHYFFISPNQTLSLNELQSIQKRAVLSFVFAIGLAISISRKTQSKLVFNLFYLGLAGPVILYFVSQNVLPEIVHISYTDPNYFFYISKYQFVFSVIFCVLWSLYLLKDAFIYKKNFIISFISISLVILSLISFYKINGKNGMMYSAIALGFFVLRILFNGSALKIKQLIYLIVPLLVIVVLFSQHVQENPTWKYLTQDLNMGWQTETYDNWKYRDGQNGILVNPSGKNVSLTSYERAAWFKEGVKLIPDNPFGYGLIQDSFKYLTKSKWPDSDLTHSHSGWLDLILGFGIPGFISIFGAMLMAFVQCAKSQNFYAKSGTWVLPMMGMAFLTSELCEKGSFELFLFVITFYGTISSKSLNLHQETH